MRNSLIPVIPGLDEPIAMLDACHERVLAQLQTLERLVPWLQEHGADNEARQAARAVMRYFDVAGVNHHLDEEEDILPALRAAQVDAATRQDIEKLSAWVHEDHQRLYAAWAVVRTELAAVAEEGRAELDAAQVAAFAHAYRTHIEREETELLPLARRILDAAVVERISHTMTQRRRTPGAGGTDGRGGI